MELVPDPAAPPPFGAAMNEVRAQQEQPGQGPVAMHSLVCRCSIHVSGDVQVGIFNVRDRMAVVTGASSQLGANSPEP